MKVTDTILLDIKHIDDEEHRLDNVERIDVLPYHTMGIYKYEKLGIFKNKYL